MGVAISIIETEHAGTRRDGGGLLRRHPVVRWRRAAVSIVVHIRIHRSIKTFDGAHRVYR